MQPLGFGCLARCWTGSRRPIPAAKPSVLRRARSRPALCLPSRARLSRRDLSFARWGAGAKPQTLGVRGDLSISYRPPPLTRQERKARPRLLGEAGHQLDILARRHLPSDGTFAHRIDAEGVVGDLAGYSFFNIQGKPVDTVMNDRVIGLSLEQLRAIPCVIAIASESTKATAILGALRTGVIDVLATSASNARSVINMQKAL